jgi:hypothetical protein
MPTFTVSSFDKRGRTHERGPRRLTWAGEVACTRAAASAHKRLRIARTNPVNFAASAH